MPKPSKYASLAPAATISTAPAPSGAPAPSTTPAASATPAAPVAMQPATVVTATPAVHPLQQVVQLGKVYNVRPATQNDNVRSWQAICAYLAANGGQATVAQLTAHLQAQYNHANMVGYCVRRGYLAPAQPAAPPAATTTQPATQAP